MSSRGPYGRRGDEDRPTAPSQGPYGRRAPADEDWPTAPSGSYGRRADEDRPTRRRDEDRSPYDTYRPSSRPDSPVHERRGKLPLRPPDTQSPALRKEQSTGIPTGPRIPSNVAVTPTGPRGSAGVAAVLEEWNISQAAVNKLEQQMELKVAALGQRFAGKPSEQPSLPEYQNKIRRQLEKEIESLRTKLNLAKARHAKFNSDLAVMLTEKMPLELQNLVQQIITDNLKTYVADIQEKNAKQIEGKTAPLLSKIGGVELKVGLLEAQTSQTKTDDPRYDVQQKTIEELMLRLQAVEEQQKEKATETAIAKPAFIQAVEESGFAHRLAALEASLEASQAKEKEHYVQLNEKLTEDLASLRVEVTSLDKKLSESNASLHAETVQVATKVATLSAVVKSDYQAAKVEIEGVTASFEHLTSRLNEADKKVTDHGKSLARLDINILEKVADSFELEWDRVQTAVSSALPGLQSRVDQLAESLPKVEKRVDQLDQQTTEMKQVSEAVPELQGRIKKFDETEEAMKQLVESVPTLQKRAETYDQNVPDLQRRVDQLEHEIKEMKHLAESVPKLQDRVEKLDAKTEQKAVWGVVQQYMQVHPTKQQTLTTNYAAPQHTSKQLPPAAGVTVTEKNSELELKVSNVDAVAQATVARVKELGKKLGIHDKKLEEHSAGFFKIGQTILDMIEKGKDALRGEFNRDLKELENRLLSRVTAADFKQLEARLESSVTGADLKELENRMESRVAAQKFPISAEDIESFRIKVEDTEGTVAKLNSDVKDLGAKIGKVDYIDHQVTALETRCDNISTSKIVEAVIARIRTMWSDPAALAANIGLLDQNLQAFQVKVEGQLRGILQSIGSGQRQLQNPPSQSQSPVTQNTQLAGNKRRRTDTLNPDGRGAATNGNHR